MAKLAIAGGAPVRTKAFTEWPQFDEREKRAILSVLESRNWGGYPFPNHLAELFSQRFAAHQDANHALCAANG
ncbi:MAG: DegT/DnrJ/EryC1/StrS family aminotransferase, partial [Blastocatellia bacterium]